MPIWAFKRAKDFIIKFYVRLLRDCVVGEGQFLQELEREISKFNTRQRESSFCESLLNTSGPAELFSTMRPKVAQDIDCTEYPKDD